MLFRSAVIRIPFRSGRRLAGKLAGCTDLIPTPFSFPRDPLVASYLTDIFFSPRNAGVAEAVSALLPAVAACSERADEEDEDGVPFRSRWAAKWAAVPVARLGSEQIRPKLLFFSGG